MYTYIWGRGDLVAALTQFMIMVRKRMKKYCISWIWYIFFWLERQWQGPVPWQSITQGVTLPWHCNSSPLPFVRPLQKVKVELNKDASKCDIIHMKVWIKMHAVCIVTLLIKRLVIFKTKTFPIWRSKYIVFVLSLKISGSNQSHRDTGGFKSQKIRSLAG